MQGIETTRRRRGTAGAFVIVAAVCALIVALPAGGAGAADAKRGSYHCDYGFSPVGQKGKWVVARGYTTCTGSGLARQVVRVCLLQGRNLRVVDCTVRSMNGPGVVRAVATRRCAEGRRVGFVTRVQARFRLDDGRVQTKRDFSSSQQLRRDCIA
jgi:hypothetical protein